MHITERALFIAAGVVLAIALLLAAGMWMMPAPEGMMSGPMMAGMMLAMAAPILLVLLFAWIATRLYLERRQSAS